MATVVNESPASVTINSDDEIRVIAVSGTGPSGTDGADGADGLDGAQGPAGPAGADGSFIVNETGTVADQIVGYDSGEWKNRTLSLKTKQTLDTHAPLADSDEEMDLFGGLELIGSGETLSNGTPVPVSTGCGKMILVVNAGTDLVGDIVVTGDTRDRNTGAITAGDTETITLAGVSTDTSDTDAEGNERHAFTGGYITSKWFQGSVVISTTEVDVSDLDVYNVAFHQFGDTPTLVEIETFDVTAFNRDQANGWVYAYLYSIEVVAGRCDVSRLAEIVFSNAELVINNRHWRGKIGNIGKELTPSTDGIWAEIFAGAAANNDWEDFSVVIVYNATQEITFS